MSSKDVYEQFQDRKYVLEDVSYDEVDARLSSFYEWLQSEEVTKTIIDELKKSVDIDEVLKEANYNNPPKATTRSEVAAVGLFFMSQIHEGTEVHNLSDQYGIHPPYTTSSLQDEVDELMKRYINPALQYVEVQIEKKCPPKSAERFGISTMLPYPPEISNSLAKFQKDNPQYNSNGFIIMNFGETKAHAAIIDSIRSTLKKFGLRGLRADDKEYHDELYGNVLTYMYGCSFGIAVFERLEDEYFNPNVSLEVGYMKALGKSVCLLKDKTLKKLQTDLVGKLYKSFDPQAPFDSIPKQLEGWLRDKDILKV